MQQKKRVLIFSEYWSSRGGGEKYVASIIETLLRSGYDVTIATQAASPFDRDAVARYFQVTIEGARIVEVDGDLPAFRRRAEHLSREFDLCLYLTNYRFFNSQARQTFVILQIPYGSITPLSLLGRVLRWDVRELAKDFYRLRLLHHLKTTQAVLVYSKFVHDALERIHDIPSTVLEPPIDDFLVEGVQKERVILSVGRFFRGLYNNKRYDVLIEAFKHLCTHLPNTTWQYRLVGSCGEDQASQRYLAELREAAKGFPIYFAVNASYEDLRRHYNEATLFWHAAGFGINEEKHPERAEHFGMSTLEAMSARCVPVVINRGGQKEIVSHAESGYLWFSVDELVEHSLRLINDQSLLAAMQANARARSKEFDREHFSNKLLAILEP